MRAVPASIPALPEHSADLRVFIAEDSAFIRVRMVNLVTGCAGVACVGWADSVRESIAGVRRTRPHGLILDLQLLDGCGLEVLRSVRIDEPALRVVVCSNWATAQHLAACREAGDERVLDKAAEFAELRNVVQHWARLRGAAPSIH